MAIKNDEEAHQGLDEKREQLKKLLLTKNEHLLLEDDIFQYSYDSFMNNIANDFSEVQMFTDHMDEVKQRKLYTFEQARLQSQTTETAIYNTDGDIQHLINMSSYNYLGFGTYPSVIAAAKDALDQYGLGAASSPVISGTLQVHKELEQSLLDFLDFDKNDYAVSLFSSGYGACMGSISAYIKAGGYVILDKSAHMSLVEGAFLSRGEIRYFSHNDIEHLASILQEISCYKSPILICTEGVYSADGDKGKVNEIVDLAHRYGGKVLVDEAHSMLIAGANGRGVVEEQGVLEKVDMIVVTFSKAFAGVGGALIANRRISQYVNWYAKCRMFSCALDPAVTAGITAVIKLSAGEEGKKRRKQLLVNAKKMRMLLRGKVDILDSDSWIIPVPYRDERLTLLLGKHFQMVGLDVGMLTYPAVPKGQARIRLFITSAHNNHHLEKASEIIIAAAKKFNFHL